MLCLLSVGTGGDWGEGLVVSGLVGGELVDRAPSPTWEECSFEMRVVAAVEGAIWASLLGVTDSPWLASGSAIRGSSIPSRLGFISSSWCSISSWCSALGTWTKMSSVVGIGSASSIGPIWLSSKGGWGAARFGPTSVPDILGACVKVERFKTAVRKGKWKKVGSTSLFSAEEGKETLFLLARLVLTNALSSKSLHSVRFPINPLQLPLSESWLERLYFLFRYFFHRGSLGGLRVLIWVLSGLLWVRFRQCKKPSPPWLSPFDYNPFSSYIFLSYWFGLER